MVFRHTSAAIIAAAMSAASPPAYDADAVALFARMTSEPDAERKGLINALIVGAKDDGWWSSLDWLTLLAAHDSQASLLNWKPGSKTLTNSGATFTTDRGWTGDASSAYLSLGEAFNASGNLFSQDNASVGAWCNLQGAAGGVKPHVSDLNTTSVRVMLNAGAGGGQETFRINDATNTPPGTSASRLGHRTIVRADSANKKFSKGGSATSSYGVASVGTRSDHGCLLRSLTNYVDDRLAAFYSGGALSDTDIANIHGRLNTYLTAIGAA